MKYNLYSKKKMFLINMEDSSYIEFPYIYIYTEIFYRIHYRWCHSFEFAFYELASS